MRIRWSSCAGIVGASRASALARPRAVRQARRLPGRRSRAALGTPALPRAESPAHRHDGVAAHAGDPAGLGDGVVRAFAALVVAQAAHSIEEYTFRLYDTFPPARFVTSLVSADRARGFVIVNVALVAFGV